MADLPVMLRVSGRRCVVVGGGGVACRRVKGLLAAGADVTVIAPHIDKRLTKQKITMEHRSYERGDLAGAMLVVIATDNPDVNHAVEQDARQGGVLINRADDPGRGDISIPAHAHHGPITLAVSTSGISAAAAAAIRQQLSEALDPLWPILLETVMPFRELIQQQIHQPRCRHGLLTQLTDHQAMEILKLEGPAGLRRHCERLLESYKAKAVI